MIRCSIFNDIFLYKLCFHFKKHNFVKKVEAPINWVKWNRDRLMNMHEISFLEFIFNSRYHVKIKTSKFLQVMLTTLTPILRFLGLFLHDENKINSPMTSFNCIFLLALKTFSKLFSYGIIHLICTQTFLKNQYFLSHDMHTCLCIRR